MNIHCMHCGHSIDLGAAYDAYSGPLRCSVCKGVMTVRIVGGQLRAMEPHPAPAPTAAVGAAPTPRPRTSAAPAPPRSESH